MADFHDPKGAVGPACNDSASGNELSRVERTALRRTKLEVYLRSPVEDRFPSIDARTTKLLIDDYIDRPSETLTTMEQAAAGLTDEMELFGTISSFDPKKGIGYIQADTCDITPVFLHMIILRLSGFQSADSGARIHCRVVKRPYGLKAIRILSIGDDHATSEPIKALPFGPNGEWEAAWVKWFNEVKGYGFLTRGNGKPDVYVDLTTLRKCGAAILRPRQKVSIKCKSGPTGPTVTDIRADAHTTA